MYYLECDNGNEPFRSDPKDSFEEALELHDKTYIPEFCVHYIYHNDGLNEEVVFRTRRL